MTAEQGQKGRRPTIRDVASLARVSVQTVSNVTRGRFDLMGPETRARVEEAMREVGYHPNIAAQGLRQARTRTLGFLVLDEATSFLADPLTAMMVGGIGDVARDADYGVLIHAERPSSDRRRRLVKPLLEQRVDGAAVLIAGEPAPSRLAYIRELVDVGAPIVVFDEPIEDRSVLSVRTDERQTARQLTEHVLSRGHRRIAFIAARLPWPVVEQRFLGYSEALEAAGIQLDSEITLFEAAWQAEGGREMTEKLLAAESPPTAVICGSDLLALGAMCAAERAQLRVPDDIAIAGFDDFEFSEYLSPRLTTVRVAGYEMGRIAARMLIDVLEGRSVRSPHVKLANELIVRESV